MPRLRRRGGGPWPAGGPVRHLPCGARPTTLLWLKRLWRCAERACPVRTWSETCAHVRSRASLTERARREACRLVGEGGLDVVAVAMLFGVGCGTAMRAVREHGQPLIDDPRRLTEVVAVRVDETAFLAARRGQHTQFVTGSLAWPGLAGLGRSCSTSSWLRRTALCRTLSRPAPRAGDKRSRPPRSSRSAATPPP